MNIYCEDCKWCSDPGDRGAVCLNPVSQYDGQELASRKSGPYCTIARKYYSACGPDAKFFEKRDPQIEKNRVAAIVDKWEKICGKT